MYEDPVTKSMGINVSAGRKHIDRDRGRPLYGLRRTHAARDDELACRRICVRSNPAGLLDRFEAAGITLQLDATGETRRGIALHAHGSIPSPILHFFVVLIHGD
jgi:hypothetical protein